MTQRERARMGSGLYHTPRNPALERQRQKHHHKVKASLADQQSKSRPARVTEQDSV